LVAADPVVRKRRAGRRFLGAPFFEASALGALRRLFQQLPDAALGAHPDLTTTALVLIVLRLAGVSLERDFGTKVG
jgi:hypothetical protein